MTACCISAHGSRRDFFRKAIAGAAAAGLAAAPGVALAGHCEVLLLTCMDYRLQNEIPAYMEGRGLKDQYDHIVLAGASLGAVNEKVAHWNAAFWEHLDAALSLHHINKVMVLDHKDCGAYKLLLGEAAVKTPELEMQAHTLQLRRLAGQILAKHPHLEVEIGLMALDGSVTEIAVGGKPAQHGAGAPAAPTAAKRKASPPV